MTKAGSTLQELTSSATQQADPDAELLRLWRLFQRQRAVVYAFLVGVNRDETALRGAIETRRKIARLVEKLQPVTIAGERARAAIALAMLIEDEPEEVEWADADVKLAAETLRILLAKSEAPGAL
jgi:hypothetical protein